MANHNFPLDGVKVLELGTHVAVPLATRVFADWGASVIKIEGLSGDPWRVVGQNQKAPVADDLNPYFTLQNANKEMISLNLKDEKGKEIFFKLVEDCDIFVSSMRLKALKNLGVDPDTLLAKYPKLVYGHFTGYGYNGPDCDKPGFDVVAFWSRTGSLVDWGAQGGFPFLPPTGAGDSMTGSILASALLAAFIGAKSTGKGTLVSTSLYGAGCWYNGNYIISSQYGNVLPKDKNKPNNPLGQPFQCSDDEWLFLGVDNYKLKYPIVCEVLGLDDIKEDERFCTIGAAKENVEELLGIVREAMKKQKRDDLVAAFGERNIVCGPIRHVADIPSDPQARENGYVVPVTFPSGDTVDMPGNPVHFGSYDKPDYKCTNEIGRDTDAVLGRYGYSPAELEELKKNGSIK